LPGDRRRGLEVPDLLKLFSKVRSRQLDGDSLLLG
jgi:putative ABC transport system ATP-binding protein